MPACATQKIITDQPTICNLFLQVPDTDFRDFLDEVEELARFAPGIITAVEKDLDAHAREKKKLRLSDQKFYDSQTGDFPELDIEDGDLRSDDLILSVGRPRMPPKAVYMFLMMRGFLGSMSTQQSVRFLHESISVYVWLFEDSDRTFSTGVPVRAETRSVRPEKFQERMDTSLA